MELKELEEMFKIEQELDIPHRDRWYNRDFDKRELEAEQEFDDLKEGMHNFKLGDKVYHRADAAPFEVVGIRKETVEIQGDWSGGTHNVIQRAWVNHTEIQPYDETKVRYYIDGKPYRNGQPLT